MRISWRELDWISERDRHEIERRMHVLGGESGLLDRVDFSGTPSKTGAFEIRITANAAKRQIIAIRRDPQRVKAFNSAFEALERSVTSVLKHQHAQPRPERAAAPRATPPSRPALALEAPAQLRRWIAQGRVWTALALAGGLTALAVFLLWIRPGPREIDVAARAEVAAFSAVAERPVAARTDAEPAYSARARLSAGR
jgi:hypothetical protein